MSLASAASSPSTATLPSTRPSPRWMVRCSRRAACRSSVASKPRPVKVPQLGSVTVPPARAAVPATRGARGLPVTVSEVSTFPVAPRSTPGRNGGRTPRSSWRPSTASRSGAARSTSAVAWIPGTAPSVPSTLSVPPSSGASVRSIRLSPSPVLAVPFRSPSGSPPSVSPLASRARVARGAASVPLPSSLAVAFPATDHRFPGSPGSASRETSAWSSTGARRCTSRLPSCSTGAATDATSRSAGAPPLVSCAVTAVRACSSASETRPSRVG